MKKFFRCIVIWFVRLSSNFILECLTNDRDILNTYHESIVTELNSGDNLNPSNIALTLCILEVRFGFTNNLSNSDLFEKWTRESLRNFLISRLCFETDLVEQIVIVFFAIKPKLLQPLKENFSEAELTIILSSIPQYTKYLNGY